MGDLALDVERLIAASAAEKRTQAQEGRNLFTEIPSQEHAICISECSEIGKTSVEFDGAVAEPNSARCPGEVLKKGGIECRICQEEDDLSNLETPCACSGTVKYAHRKCVQRWCNEKGDTTCEICHQPYQSGYTAPPQPVHADGIPGELRQALAHNGEWRISGAHQLDLIDPRILTIAAAERQFLEAEYDEYASANASGAACCRSAALILMALLLLRHALAMAAAGANGGDTSTFFTLFLLRVAGFMLPCYIMARAMNILQRRRQRQGAIAAAEMALLLQGAQARGTLRFSVASGNSSVNDSA